MRVDGQRLTSWQRKRVRQGSTGEEVLARSRSKATKKGTKSEEHQLNVACTEAKRQSEAARERYRNHVAPEPGDDALVAAYAKAKAAMRAFHASKDGSSVTTATEPRHQGFAAPTAPQPKPVKAAAASTWSSGKREGEAPEGRAPKASRRKLSHDTKAAPSQASNLGGRGKDSTLSATDARKTDEPPPTRWTCAVCDVTIFVRTDGRAREQHIAGKAHQRNLQAQQGGAQESR